MGRGRVVVIGSANVDHTIRVERLPAPGATVLGHSYAVVSGGKGANQAVTAARLAASTSFVGVVGDDQAGQDLLALLGAEGIDVTHVRVQAGTSTGLALITVDEKGRNTIVVAPQANAELRPEQVDDAVDLVAGAGVLLVQLEVPLAAVGRALEVARGAGVTTILNPSPAPPLPRLLPLLPLVDVVVPNQTEAASLTGSDDPAQAAYRLVSRGAGSAVVTMGEAGAIWFDGTSARHVAAFPTEEVDPTAAGDAFLGGLAAALAEGRPLVESLDWASAAGSFAVSRHGALTSLPGRADIAGRLAAGRP